MVAFEFKVSLVLKRQLCTLPQVLIYHWHYLSEVSKKPNQYAISIQNILQTWSSLHWKNKYGTSYVTILARYSMLYYSSLQLGIQKIKKREKKGRNREKKSLKCWFFRQSHQEQWGITKKHLKPLTKCFAGIGTATQFS